MVGLGKTLEIGLILAELIRRGRGDRILVVTPQQVLEQFQLELWTRFAIPLIRLDSVGIERIQREIPAGRNPFTYYKRIIISVDTLKNEGRSASTSTTCAGTRSSSTSRTTSSARASGTSATASPAPRQATDALLLASATPHNGDAESFAELIRMLDPAAIADARNYQAKDIQHLYIRRTKISREVTNEIGGKWTERGPSVAIRCPRHLKPRKAVFEELTRTWLADPAAPRQRHRPAACSPTPCSRRSYPATRRSRRPPASGPGTAPTTPRRPRSHASRRSPTQSPTPTRPSSPTWSASSPRSASARRAARGSSSSPSRVPTLEWLHETLPAASVSPRQARSCCMHGGLSDTRQQEIIEQFAPRRLTGPCPAHRRRGLRGREHAPAVPPPHPLRPALVADQDRAAQRPHRPVRQVHQPQFAALILTSAIEGAKDDTTVAEKLLKRDGQRTAS